ncbi:ImmA/IrrE family metallo-endopeptidase [Thalassotalea euphylliae]|uniref:ImmA/IrrE family metallo-endopeptidase n=1 Tax=Thalassotalea euphylliae TaxID=1655234 RepID=UPI003629A1B9
MLDFTVVDDEELGSEEARTYPNEKHILISNSVYEGAADCDGRDRFTIAHEIGHLDLHKGQTPMFSRGDHQIFEDSEWQADTFASEFLMDSRHITPADTVESLMKKFGVSKTAAGLKLKKMRK